MLDEKSSIPLYSQLYQKMMENITSGKWPDGFKLPTEAELCQQYGVSRITVRMAMDKLNSQGYLYRKQGRGSFITQPKIEQKLAYFYSFSDNIDHPDEKRQSTVLSFEAIPCPDKIAQRLQIPAGEPVFKMERIRSVGTVPFAYEFSYIPCSLCPQLNGPSIAEIGLYNSLGKYSGLVPNLATEQFTAVLLGKKAARYLQGKSTQPGLHIDRITFVDQRIIEYCDTIVRGDRITYHVELHQI